MIGLLSVAFAFAVLAPTSAVHAADAKVKKNYMVFQNVRYYKAHASSVQLGSWGRKKTPIIGANFLDDLGRVKPDYYQKSEVVVFGLDQANTSFADFTANATSAAFGDVSASGAYEKLKNGSYKFAKIDIKNLERFRKEINGNKNLLARLKKQGKLRFVTEIIVILDHKEVENMKWSGKATASDIKVANGKLKLSGSLSGGGTRDTSVTINKGVVYAYMLHKPKWKKKVLKKDTIKELRMDQHAGGI